MNDSAAQAKASATILVLDVDPQDYEAVYFVGGKGAMFDFPDNEAIQTLIKNHYSADKVVGAVCHGPAALVNVMLDGSEALLAHKEVTGENSWSVWKVAESMIMQLGHTPRTRPPTAEERSMAILLTYETFGYQRAKAQVSAFSQVQGSALNYMLITCTL